MNYSMSNKELTSLLNDCSSVKKEIKLPDGRMKYIWKQRAVLNSDGNPIGLTEFMRRERVILNPPVISTLRNSREEVKNAKKEYAEFMLKKFGKNWRTEMKGATMRLLTFRQLSILLK